MIPLNLSLGSYIIELKVEVKSIKAKVRSIEVEMQKGGKCYQHLMGQRRILKMQLADFYDKLGHAYEEKGKPDSAKCCFAHARDERK